MHLGQRSKPDWCYANCGYHGGTGFAPVDSVEKIHTAKVCFILEMLGSWEAFYSRPLSGNTGKLFFEQFVFPLGYTREDCLIDNALRCHAEGNKYPGGKARVTAEAACRHWDAAIDAFDPNVLSLTYHPSSLFEEKQRHRLIRESVARAFYWYEQGYRPVLLFGAKARDVHAPWLTDDIKRWNNSWQPINWKPRGNRESLVQIREFWEAHPAASTLSDDASIERHFLEGRGSDETESPRAASINKGRSEASQRPLSLEDIPD